MKNQMIDIQSWQSTTVTRPSCVVSAYGFGMGDVRPMTLNGFAAVANKRHAAATHAVVKGFGPWSPPVT